MQIPFAMQSYKSASLPLSAQRLINAFAEQEPEDAKSQVAVFGAPGLVEFATCGLGPVRGMRVMGDTVYVVSGQFLYSVDEDGVSTPVGGSISGNGVVSMSDNGTQVCIVNGVTGYTYDTTSGFRVISSANFHAANTVTFIDTYFAFDWIGTNRFFISNSGDGSAYDGLDYGAAEVAPDFVVAVINQQENLLVFNQHTIETHYDAGAVNFPFLRVDGATIERGCIAPLSLVKEDNSVFFLGDDGIYYRLNGTTPIRVSTHALEAEWATYATLSDAFAFSYPYHGHKFVCLTFPSANATFIYDVATGMWHERESWNENDESLQRWRGNCRVSAYGKELIGDAYSGRIGYITGDVFTEFGNTTRMVMTSAPIHSDQKRVFISKLEADMETGVGLTTGQGSDPQVMLEWSKDGGRTFAQFQPWQTLGKIGAYLTRLRWLRLGQARQWVFRITMSDPVKRVFIAAHADMMVGE